MFYHLTKNIHTLNLESYVALKICKTEQSMKTNVDLDKILLSKDFVFQSFVLECIYLLIA